MKSQKISIWYDEEGDYLEINLKKSKNTHFNEIKKDFAEIIDQKTKKVIGYAVFNFTKRKDKLLEFSIPISKELTA